MSIKKMLFILSLVLICCGALLLSSAVLSDAIMDSLMGDTVGIKNTGIASLIIGVIGSIVSFFLKDSYSKKDKNNGNKEVK